MIDWKQLVHRQLKHDHSSESHTEPDCNTFHPSALSQCERQCTISKLGLETHGINTLWNFYLGTRQHTDLQSWFEDRLPAVEFEKELTHREPTTDNEHLLCFTGHCDVYDPIENAVYDFKTRKSWKGFDEPSDAHKDQLTTYMRMSGATKGQLVYLVKSAPWDEYEPILKVWPESEYFAFDPDRWSGIRDRAERITSALKEFEREHDRLPETIGEVPFESCGCWLCNSESNGEDN